MRLPKLVAGLATALAVAVPAGCGSSGSSSSGVTAAAYVKSVCTAVAPFEADVVKRSDELNVATLANAAQGKKAIQVFLSAVADDTDQTISKLKAAGTPNVSNGEQLGNTVVSAFTQLKAAVGHAAAQADALPTNSPEAFKTAATNLGATVRTSMTGIGASLGKLRSPELEKAAAKEPACTSLAGAKQP